MIPSYNTVFSGFKLHLECHALFRCFIQFHSTFNSQQYSSAKNMHPIVLLSLLFIPVYIFFVSSMIVLGLYSLSSLRQSDSLSLPQKENWPSSQVCHLIQFCDPSFTDLLTHFLFWLRLLELMMVLKSILKCEPNILMLISMI